ncbi:uncharacterized protein [Onthophagus taurus]|uniref:uncharacterized protein n=1 Tax=Onthophagus taurus TaxID=166361 RepID=UPI0039BDB18C
MLIMPSANMRNSNASTGSVPVKAPEFTISAKDVEGLVLEIKENLRVSTTMKAIPCSHLSRKSSRASPYRVPNRIICPCENSNNTISSTVCECGRKLKRKPAQDNQEDPYELLQRLLRDGSLVNEAVRRVQLGLSPKQRYFYESDDDTSPMLRLCAQEN